MRRRVRQPAIQPALRDPERHDFWPGFICALIGLIVMFVGARHLTGVETTDGGSAWETQLIKAFSSGGIEIGIPAPKPAAVGPDGLPEPAVAPEPEPREPEPGLLSKVRVNLGAKTPCPT